MEVISQKIRKIGTSLGVIIPKNVIKNLNLKADDYPYILISKDKVPEKYISKDDKTK